MEKAIYTIERKGESTDYIQGRISGMITAICPESQIYAHRCTYSVSDGFFKTKKLESIEMRVDATEEEYAKLKQLIERFYPTLCTFYKREG